MTDFNKHNRIQRQICIAFEALGIEAIQEHSGKGWSADVFVPNAGKPIAFEIQLSAQSLSKTIERQSRYIRDGIVGCWLFEKPVSKLTAERPDLPVFYVEGTDDSNLLVNLGDRRKITLPLFLKNFIAGNIQFRPSVRTKSLQHVSLVFYEMICWKCKKVNHLYYVETPFYSSCNATIEPDEFLWESNQAEYRAEIIDFARKVIDNNETPGFKLGAIKPRFSNTVGKSYISFGCYNCDSIFGDFYVMEAKNDMQYETDKLRFQGVIELQVPASLEVPHWCFPEGDDYCDAG